jgi:hypothetical protein
MGDAPCVRPMRTIFWKTLNAIYYDRTAPPPAETAREKTPSGEPIT